MKYVYSVTIATISTVGGHYGLYEIQVAWHMGHPLSQTLFTSIYLDNLLWPVPRTVEDARFDRVPSESPLISLVLRAYCLALVKACDFVHARIVAEYYYEVG